MVNWIPYSLSVRTNNARKQKRYPSLTRFLFFVTAAEKANINPALIHANLPRDFVLWIDPFSVSYRVGDHGSIMTLFEDRSRGRIVFKVDPNSPNTSPLLARTTSLAVRISPPNSPSRNAKQQSSPVKQQQDNIPDHQQQEQQQQDDKNDKLVMANWLPSLFTPLLSLYLPHSLHICLSPVHLICIHQRHVVLSLSHQLCNI